MSGSGAPISGGAASPAKRWASRLKRMWDPRVTYNETEVKKSRAWWMAFMLGILTIGIITLITLIMVRCDRKLLKQMGLALAYMSLTLMLLGFVITLSSAATQSSFELAAYGLMLVVLNVISFLFGCIIAWYAQCKIDSKWAGAA